LVSPEDGIEMANLQDFTFKFNNEDVNVVMYKVIDNNPDDPSQAVIKTNVLSSKNENGELPLVHQLPTLLHTTNRTIRCMKVALIHWL
jgi:hypothetical protein